MNVPATIETPMTIAKAVSSARTLRPAMPFRATAIIASSPAPACPGSGARSTSGVVGYVAVGEEQHTVGDCGGVGGVGDHDGRLADRVDRVAPQRQHLAAPARVEVPVGSSASITVIPRGSA